MSNESGFDYDVLISRLHGGVRAFQSLRAHRRQRDQVPVPDEHPTSPPSRSAAIHHDAPGDMRAASPLEPQAFIAMNGRVVPLFGDLGAGMFVPAAPPGTTPPSPVHAPPVAAQRPPPAPEETQPLPTAPAPAASPLKLPLPTPPARLGLIPRSPATDPAPPANAAKVQEAPSVAAIAALLDARAQEESQRLEKVHAEHRACVATLLQEHREQLRAQSEANAAHTSQLLRGLLEEHRAELARANQAHTEHLSQVLSQHQQHVQLPREPAAPPDTELRSALIEQAKFQREANEDTAEHIGALTTIIADLGQVVGLIAVAAVESRQSVQPLSAPAPVAPPPLHITPVPQPAPVSAESAPPPPLPPSATAEHALTSPGAPQSPRSPPITGSPPATARDRARVLQCVDDDRDDDDLTSVDDAEASPRSRIHPLTPHKVPEESGDD